MHEESILQTMVLRAATSLPADDDASQAQVLKLEVLYSTTSD
jgi:hypothetical protein